MLRSTLILVATIATLVACFDQSKVPQDAPVFSPDEAIAIVETRLISVSFNSTNTCLEYLRERQNWPDEAIATYEGEGVWYVKLGDLENSRWSWRVFENSGATSSLSTDRRAC